MGKYIRGQIFTLFEEELRQRQKAKRNGNLFFKEGCTKAPKSKNPVIFAIRMSVFRENPVFFSKVYMWVLKMSGTMSLVFTDFN